jgi:hypothetical protein
LLNNDDSFNVFGLLKSILQLDFFYQLQNLDTVIHNEIIIWIQCTPIILIIDVMICIYFVLIWTLSLCNLCNIGLENKVIIIITHLTLFILFLLAIVWYVLFQITDFDNLDGTFKLFLLISVKVDWNN